VQSASVTQERSFEVDMVPPLDVSPAVTPLDVFPAVAPVALLPPAPAAF
jgi:hypothetical protein